MNDNELNALASNLKSNDDKASFMVLVEELDRLNTFIKLKTELIDRLVGELNENKEYRDRIARDLRSYFEE